MKILLIDDDVNLGKVVQHQLRQQGYEVENFTNGPEALKHYTKSSFDIIITDIQMPELSGIEILKQIRSQNRDIVIIMITAYGSVDNAIEACRLGADDYISKPFGKEQLLFTIEKAVRLRKLETENRHLKTALTEKFHFKNIIAESGPMQNVFRTIEKIAPSDATVLINGESGTGKELIAKAIHQNSSRRDKALVTVNCPSIPTNLLESELFGHVKGAFTGAFKDRKGKFELANGGSIFLDEIGDLHPDLQVKLLRVLQEQEFEMLGSNRTIKVDVRVIAATNRDLGQLIAEKKFREDLYYRLSVIPITLPPLRNRSEDIPYLADYFLKKYGGGKDYSFSEKVLKMLISYTWPGNVRELQNAVEHMVTLSKNLQIGIEDVPSYIQIKSERETPGHSPDTTVLSLEEMERQIIEETLARTGGNKSKAARILRVPRHVLLYRLKKFGAGN